MPKEKTMNQSRRLSASLNFSPVRRLFSSSSKSKAKRPRSDSSQDRPLDPIVDTPTSIRLSHSHQHDHSRPDGCIAILNDDFIEDAVIVTALDGAPFCCHEDLLSMPRAALIDVGRTLNAKLPKILHVDLEQSTTFIRNSIEVLVGIRQTQGATTPTTTPNTTPRRHSTGFDYTGGLAARGTPKLSRLDEEEGRDEDADDSDADSMRAYSKRLTRSSTLVESPTHHPRNRTPSLPLHLPTIDTTFVTIRRPPRKRTLTVVENPRTDVYGVLPPSGSASSIEVF